MRTAAAATSLGVRGILDRRLLARRGTGTFHVDIGPRRVDRLLARVCGHRRRGPVTVTLEVDDIRPGTQRWTRRIAGSSGTTTVRTTVRADGDVVVERLGPVELVFGAAVLADHPGATGLTLQRARLVVGPLGVGVPARWRPIVACTTRVVGAGLHVDVDVRWAGGRRAVSYAGTLRGTGS